MATYKERTTPDITIYRPSLTGESEAVLTVPITEDSKRVFSLMTEDYIELHFTIAEAVAVEVGDYVDDEIFGRFIITTKQMPSYDTATGGYDYTIKLEREYRKWNNKVFMLTAVITGGDRVRKESNWSLTSDLKLQAEEVIHNLNVLGERWNALPYLYEIDTDKDMTERATEVHCQSYTGTKILDALTEIANTWECEWWVAYEKVGGKDRGVLHFGKCETTDEEQTLTLDSNMENVSAQSNRSTYCNRLLAFGSSQNVPDTYRKTLSFTVTNKDTATSGFYDSSKPITEAMLSGTEESEIGFRKYTGSSYFNHKTDGSKVTIFTTLSTLARFTVKGSTATFAGAFDISCTLKGSADATVPVSVLVLIVDESGKEIGKVYEKSEEFAASFQNGYTVYSHSVNFAEAKVSTGSGTFYIQTKVIFDAPTGIEVYWATGKITPVTSSFLASCVTVEAATDTHTGTLQYNGQSYPIRWAEMESGGFGLTFASSTPSGFGIGSEYTLDFYDGSTDGLLINEIPMAWWTSQYDDPSSLALIGGNNLQLPIETNGWLQLDSTLSTDQIVERAVVFDKVFPRCVLKITDVEAIDKTSYEEQADGSKTYWNWVQYRLTAKNLNGDEFHFDKSFIKSGETLQIKFLTEAEEQEACESVGVTWQTHDGFTLAGMTFDVNFKNLSQLYTIVRNDDYGASLPNAILRPKVGDPFILVGWDVRALASMNLIQAAEEELQEKATDYLKAVEQDQFTFTCEMISEEGVWLTEGQKVCVRHDALSTTDEHGQREKHSRIIGYELKLDIPYDSPKYTVGESDAYSRLKKLESEISDLSGSTSSHTGTSSSGVSGSGSGSGGNGGSSTYAVKADEANHATTADTADYAEAAGKADTATEAEHADSAFMLDEDSPVFGDFLSSKNDDEAAGEIAFEKGVKFGSHESEKGIDADGNATLGDISGNNATLDRLKSDTAEEYLRTLIGGMGFDLYTDAQGKSHLWVDELMVRVKAYFASLEIRKISYSGGTTIFSNAGSTLAKVVPVAAPSSSPSGGSATPDVVAYKCYAVADDGTTRTMNWWKVGDQALCQTFNIAEGVCRR